jgi:hypothetical protein
MIGVLGKGISLKARPTHNPAMIRGTSEIELSGRYRVSARG